MKRMSTLRTEAAKAMTACGQEYVLKMELEAKAQCELRAKKASHIIADPSTAMLPSPSPTSINTITPFMHGSNFIATPTATQEPPPYKSFASQ
jgi:hypothetical protein